MDAEQFIELDSVAFEDVTFRQGDTIKIHIEVLYKIMEQYHQSKVNDVVLDDVMPRELTAENGAKALLIGEFHEVIDVTCSNCDGDGC